jgi:hypothetical protein
MLNMFDMPKKVCVDCSIDENIVGLDHDGLVIWEFSDDSNDDDAGVVDEW